MKFIKRLIIIVMVVGIVYMVWDLDSVQQLLGQVSTQLPNNEEQAVKAEIEPMAAVGTNLNSDEYLRTLQLLEANEFADNSIIRLDGFTLDKYLNDGSDGSTSVVSSTAIFPNETGLKIELITPTNIEEITATTYENAALTAGAKDMTIKIAAIRPVTGEGALAGVYALLDSMGYQLDEEDIKVAEDEIQIILWLKQEFNYSDELANRFVRELKRRLSEFLQTNETINDEEIRTIVISLCNEYNLVLDEEQLTMLCDFARNYVGTNFAKFEDTTEILEKPTDSKYRGDWIHLVPDTTEWTYEELLALDNPEAYRDTNKYHPIISAMFDRYFELVREDKVMGMPSMLGHTFIIEAMSPDLTEDEKAALNHLRTYIYYHAMYREEERQSYAMGEIQTVVDFWTENIIDFQQLLIDDPEKYDINQRISNATGMASESFHAGAGEITNEPNMYQVTYRNPLGAHAASRIGEYHYDRANNKFYQFDYNINTRNEIPASYDFTLDYGVAVENNYQSPTGVEEPTTIAFSEPGANFQLPTESNNSSLEELQAVDYSQFYSEDSHPIIKPFFTKFEEIIMSDDLHYDDYYYRINSLMGHTFLVDTMIGNLSDQDLASLEELRTYIMMANDLMEDKRRTLLEERNMIDYPNTVNEYWEEQIQAFEELIQNDPMLATEKQIIAIYSGLDPHIHSYQPAEYSDYIVYELGYAYFGDVFRNFNYYPETKRVERLGIVPSNNQMLQTIYDFESEYGVSIENNFQSFEDTNGMAAPESFSGLEETLNNAYQNVIDEVYNTELEDIIEAGYPASFYFGFYDIDQNGIKELILSENGIIKYIYTYDVANASTVFLEEASSHFTVRGYTSLSNDGHIYQENTGGAFYSEFKTFRMAEDGVSTELIGHYIFDQNKNGDYPYYFADNPNESFTFEQLSEVTNNNWSRAANEKLADYELYPITEPIESTYLNTSNSVNLIELEAGEYIGKTANYPSTIILEKNGGINFLGMDDNIFRFNIINSETKNIPVRRGDGSEIVDNVDVTTTVIPTEIISAFIDYYLNEELYLYYNHNNQLALAMENYEGIKYQGVDDGIYLEFVLEHN